MAFTLFPQVVRFSYETAGVPQGIFNLLGDVLGSAAGRTGSVFNSVFVQKIVGANGSETLVGSPYADELYGLGGDDVLLCGTGDDIYHFGRGGGEDEIFDAGGKDTILLDPGIWPSDVVIGRVVDLQENDGDGVFVAIHTGAGEPEFIFSHAAGDIEAIRFADGTTISGALLAMLTATNQTYFGTAGNDNALGGWGVDYLHGLAGDDVLHGGKGNDFLMGGLGNDTYLFAAGDGIDQIVDIRGDHDVLVLSGIVPDDVHAFRARGGLLVLDFSWRGQVTIQDNDIEEIQFVGTDTVWTAEDIAALG
ncbi:MAG: hypothetical protein LBR95_01780 [Azoarcus sp.]|jgi:Ca2+-binding RTX toxin-like protein|nr:hypothetical protein [Azoarcus sp.]